MEDSISKLEKYGVYARSRLDLCSWNIELLRAESKLKMCLKSDTEGF